jgi:predicted nucleotidyltransferase
MTAADTEPRIPAPDAVFGLGSGALARLRAVFAAQPGIDRVLVYGSRAKGNFRPGSDIDLVLDGARLGHEDLLRIESALDDLDLPYRIDLSLLHRIENPDLLDHIRRVGLDFLTGEKPPAPSRQVA